MSFGLFVLSDSFSQLYFLIFLLQLKNFGYLISKNSFLLFVPFFLPMLFMDEISFQKFFSPYTHCILPLHTLFLFVWQVLEDILQRTGRKPKKKNLQGPGETEDLKGSPGMMSKIREQPVLIGAGGLSPLERQPPKEKLHLSLWVYRKY